jgi:hypothetical protein
MTLGDQVATELRPILPGFKIEISSEPEVGLLFGLTR